MKITKPAYFDSFRCIASACPDSCCKEWDVQVDTVSAEYYRNLPGPLGDRLRETLYDEEDQTYLAITDGRCPMWRADGLCRIQAELGEEALCKTCREFPRLTHDYGDFVELGLELSCPEAARIILSTPAVPSVTEEVPGGELPEYDAEAMEVLQRTRKIMLSLLSDTRRPVSEVFALSFLYGCQAQSELDGEETHPFDAEAALDTARELAKPGNLSHVAEFFLSLEILTSQWRQRLAQLSPVPLTDAFRPLARYFVERYWLQAVSDYDLYCRVKFLFLSCLLIAGLGGNLTETAQLYSKEIENNTANVEALLDAAYAHPAFTDDKLLGMLLSL